MPQAWVSSFTISVVMIKVCTVNQVLRYTPRKRTLVCQSSAKRHFKTWVLFGYMAPPFVNTPGSVMSTASTCVKPMSLHSPCHQL